MEDGGGQMGQEKPTSFHLALKRNKHQEKTMSYRERVSISRKSHFEKETGESRGRIRDEGVGLIVEGSKSDYNSGGLLSEKRRGGEKTSNLEKTMDTTWVFCSWNHKEEALAYAMWGAKGVKEASAAFRACRHEREKGGGLWG